MRNRINSRLAGIYVADSCKNVVKLITDKRVGYQDKTLSTRLYFIPTAWVTEYLPGTLFGNTKYRLYIMNTLAIQHFAF